jgi:hypothetical protein
MVDGGFGLPRPQPEPTAHDPSASKAGVEHESTVNQLDGDVDVLAIISKNVSNVAQDKWIVAGTVKCPPGEVDPFAPVLLLLILVPAVDVEILAASGR